MVLESTLDEITIRPAQPGQADFIRALVAERWGAPVVAVHGQLYIPDELPAFIATSEEIICGLVTYTLGERGCELVTLDSLRPGYGIGGLLVQAVEVAARLEGESRLWLVTTNDNLNALRFYQKLGFRITAVDPGAVDRARQLKPQIPRVGDYGIPLHDEITLEKDLR